MVELFGLSRGDVQIIKAIIRWWRSGRSSKRPHARRRRNPGSTSKGGLQIVSGWLIKTVAEGSRVEDAITLETWNGSWFDPDVDENNVKIKYGAINRSPQPFRGSEAEPVAIEGFKRVVQENDANGDPQPPKTFIQIINLYDPAILPGHSKITENGKPQGGFHKSGDRRYEANGGPCLDT
jgi:hypothetical protein